MIDGWQMCAWMYDAFTQTNKDKNKNSAWMAERSKAADLSSVLFGGVGSNPTSSIIFLNFLIFCRKLEVDVLGQNTFPTKIGGGDWDLKKNKNNEHRGI